MVLFEYPAIVMDKSTLWDQVGFVAKVVAVSTLIAIALKTIGPRLPIPATASVSLAIVLAPSLVLGAYLLWQLRTSADADPPHPERDQ